MKRKEQRKKKGSVGELVAGVIMLIIGVPALVAAAWLAEATAGSPVAQAVGFTGFAEFGLALGGLFTVLGIALVWASRR